MTKKLLVVDDNADLCSMMSEMLRREGFDVDMCHDGEQAIAFLDQGRTYDLIISDLLMPKKDGISLITHARKIGLKMPIFIITGGGVTLKFEDALKAVEPLADGVFKKPMELKKLIAKINEVLLLPA